MSTVAPTFTPGPDVRPDGGKWSNTSRERKTGEDGTIYHRHECATCGRSWWDTASYGKWCGSGCFDEEPDDY